MNVRFPLTTTSNNHNQVGEPMSEVTLSTVRQVLEPYGLRTKSIQTLPSAYTPSAAWKIATQRGYMVVKPYKGSKSALTLLANRLHRLSEVGFSQFSPWLLTKSGKPFVAVGGRIYYVTKWSDGVQLGANEAQLDELGSVLKKLHSVSRHVLAGSTPGAFVAIRRFKEQHLIFSRYLDILKSTSDEEVAWFRDEGAMCIDLAEETWSILKRPPVRDALLKEVKRPMLVHGDVTRPNVLVPSHGLILIDWENAHKGSPLLEITRALANTTDFQPKYMEAILRGYERKHQQLTRGERGAICALFRLPREAWSVARQIRIGQTIREQSSTTSKHIRIRHPMSFSILKNSWSNRLNAIKWLDDWADRPIN